jgi:glycosyltransferase involved in cell wall biosynthesis
MSLPSLLRILHITEAAAAGVGRHVLDLSEGQLAAGHEVSLIYSARRSDATFCRRTRSLARLEAHRVDMRRGPHVSDAAVVRTIRGYIRAHGPFDVIHGHSSKGGAIARLVGRVGGARIVYTPHCMYTMDQEAHRLALALTRAVERRLARRTDAIIAVSPDERDHILSLGIPSEQVHCVVNGVASGPPISRAVARAKLGFAADAVVVGYLGRLSRQKNPRLLLNAFAQVVGAGSPANVRLAVAGEGDLDESLRTAARELGVADRVDWLGHRPGGEVLPAFDVFALSSNYEGMPYVLLEALAAGLPIITTDVGGARLAVKDGENGYIVSRPSPEEFAIAAKKLIDSPGRRAEFGAVSRGLAAKFSIDRMVEQTQAVYDQVLSPCAIR